MVTISLLLLFVPGLILAAIWLIWRPDWQGFADKTLWDWFSLLAVPLVVGFATFLISAAQTQIEWERASETALQQYFKRIGELALDERLEKRPEVAAAIGRAETIAILRLVEGERAGRAFAFLAEMNLLKNFAVEFEGFDISGAELKGLNLTGLDFESSDLSGSDLEGIRFRGGDFEETDLEDADLKEADLRDVSFEGANLSGAELIGADLRGADFTGAQGLTEDQIASACFDNTTVLPAGFPSVAATPADCDDDVEEDD